MKAAKIKRPSEKLLSKLHAMKEKKGMIAMIEPDTDSYILGKTTMQALKNAQKKFPGKIFYCVRIGSTFAHEHKGGIQKV